MTASLLFGPSDGWSLEPVVTWLYTEGRRIGDPLRMVEELAAQLGSAGAHIDRMAVMIRTLHPQLVGWSLYWSRQHGVRRDSFEYSSRGTDAYIGSPIQQVQEHRATVRMRVGPLPVEGEHGLVADLRAEGITDYAALPMISGAGTVHAITLATAAPTGFTDADLDRFAALANLLAPLIEIAALRRNRAGPARHLRRPAHLGAHPAGPGQARRRRPHRCRLLVLRPAWLHAFVRDPGHSRPAAPAQRLLRILRCRRGGARRRDPAVHRRCDPDRLRDRQGRQSRRGVRIRAGCGDRRLRFHRRGQPSPPARRPAGDRVRPWAACGHGHPCQCRRTPDAWPSMWWARRST